jgi:hypothetical protein
MSPGDAGFAIERTGSLADMNIPADFNPADQGLYYSFDALRTAQALSVYQCVDPMGMRSLVPSKGKPHWHVLCSELVCASTNATANHRARRNYFLQSASFGALLYVSSLSLSYNAVCCQWYIL